MKNYESSTLNRKVTFSGPSTVEEYDAKGGTGSCVEDAVAGLIAWDTLPDFHSKLVEKLVAKFGIPRGVNDKATAKAKERAKDDEAKAKVKPVPEAATAYIRRVEATTATDPDQKAEFDTLWNEVMAATEIDPSPSKRQSRGPGKDYMERAEQFLELETDALEAKITKLATLVPNVEDILVRDSDGKPTQLSLGFAIKAYVDERNKQDGLTV